MTLDGIRDLFVGSDGGVESLKVPIASGSDGGKKGPGEYPAVKQYGHGAWYGDLYMCTLMYPLLA